MGQMVKRGIHFAPVGDLWFSSDDLEKFEKKNKKNEYFEQGVEPVTLKVVRMLFH